ncbi:helix-turn-helix domain-containing protein [Piscinibacter gummiphilus]|uniref:Helix-turn-helix domain-containing protein n=1 Tax=Piscinibacter gummiphilus TaxID=946333 RepID=A0ABZ0CLU7_9BURK|nr:helix-turn-helix domain-containing protein [Piscinibacter gummiphilus]WOB05950.1 helix-turn-helix domain-containing protein [Piscinibacter gummiphilus]
MNDLPVPVAAHPAPRAARPASAATDRSTAPTPDTPTEHAYVVHGGVMYTASTLQTCTMLRRCGGIVISIDGKPFELHADDEVTLHQALVVKPLVAHKLVADDTKVVSLLVNPLHPLFRMFRGMPRHGVMSLPREAFAYHDPQLEASWRGGLDGAQGGSLYNGLITTVSRYLPTVTRSAIDDKADHVVGLLHADVNRSLDELARSVGVSYTRMSHLFTQSLGISLRNYQLWLKIHNALNMLDAGATLTQIARTTGFADLAHLSRVSRQALGAPLTYFRGNASIRKIYCPA